MIRFICAICLSFPLLAQQAGDRSITGSVINSETGEPVKYAIFMLTATPVFDPAHPPEQFRTPTQKSTQADGSGQFQFDGLDKGRYLLTAQKPGFNPGFFPHDRGPRQLNVDTSVFGVELRLVPLGVIEGTVVDQNNEPLQGVNIVALQVLINDGVRVTNSVRSVTTDDRGAFRIWNLPPGKYYVKAAGKSGGTYRYVGNGSPYYSSWQSFAPVYSGGAQTLDSAAAIEIGAGTKASADFHLALEPAFKIRGALANAPSGDIAFHLLQGSEAVSASRTSLNSSGRFEVQDVTPGAYTLRVTQAGKMRGEAQVTVRDADVNGLSIFLAPAVTLTGVTRVIGAPLKASQIPGFERAFAAALTDSDTLDVDIGPDQVIDPVCNLSLHEREGGNISFSLGARQKMGLNSDDGRTFTIGDVLPAVYAVHVQCEGGYPLSILAGGADLLTSPTLIVQPGAAPPTIEIQIKPGGGVIHGEVAVPSLPPTAGVLLVPAFSASSGPLMASTWEDETPQGVTFTLAFLAPGAYTLYAFSNWQQLEFRNPAFLQTLSGGLSVHVEIAKNSKSLLFHW